MSEPGHPFRRTDDSAPETPQEMPPYEDQGGPISGMRTFRRMPQSFVSVLVMNPALGGPPSEPASAMR